MKLHNSLTRKTEEFTPIKPGEAGLYTCGPTVYDHVQIGNLRTFIFEDLLRRTLRTNGYKLTHVMNITDIDDKTIKRSRLEQPDDEPMAALTKLTTRYEKKFYEDAKSIGIDLSDSRIVKATDHIEDMQQLIGQIPNKYVAEDGVYYDINKDPEYGMLVEPNHAHEQHRINNDEYDKDHAADFALWKVESPGEPSWQYQLDGQTLTGRPGWHIECSAMSTKYLGQPFDVHTGGIDLMFPHHENEIAQSRAASGGKKLANFFVHGEHLLVDGRKMSKSLKNFFVLDDLRERGYKPMAFRLLILQAHYRSQLNFTWDSLEGAQNNLNSLYAWADQQFQTSKPVADEEIKTFKDRFEAALADDLNSSEALAVLNQLIDKGAPGPELLEYLDERLGLDLSDREDITDDQKSLIKEREQVRSARDWVKSDQLREQLKGQGIEINDNSDGSIWSRV